MSKIPYIGIVGVKNIEEAISASASIHYVLNNFPISHRGQVGVQVTTRTLRGEKTESKRNPVVTDIPEIFRAALATRDDIFTAVHFTTREYPALYDSVCKIFDMENMYADNICRGLQLNMQFGNLHYGMMEKIRIRYPELQIIMQLHRTALETMSHGAIVFGLKSYNNCIDYVLIDPSGGRGEELVPASCVSLAERIQEHNDLAIGFAGGFNQFNVARLVEEISGWLGSNDFSIDAESGLRNKLGVGYGNDTYSPKKALAFFHNAAATFMKLQKTAC
ncbi:MAG: hypothetical protein HYT12_03330 [Candidatus Liptonbacteria bacterium]|nr:hypothetical protein [Candidatus Liptonbacteria bacterium]